MSDSGCSANLCTLPESKGRGLQELTMASTSGLLFHGCVCCSVVRIADCVCARAFVASSTIAQAVSSVAAVGITQVFESPSTGVSDFSLRIDHPNPMFEAAGVRVNR